MIIRNDIAILADDESCTYPRTFRPILRDGRVALRNFLLPLPVDPDLYDGGLDESRQLGERSVQPHEIRITLGEEGLLTPELVFGVSPKRAWPQIG
jgi:hypothetical protein